MQTHTNRQNTSYARRQALSLEMNADILVAILISVLRELKFRALKTDWKFPHICPIVGQPEEILCSCIVPMNVTIHRKHVIIAFRKKSVFV